jgi:hypothetical protein
MKIAGIILLLASAFLNFKHGWDAFYILNPAMERMLENLGINKAIMPYFGVYSITIGLMLFSPKTFFMGNVLHAVTMVLVMAMALKAGNPKIALIEIPFLAMPLVLIWLKYPFTFKI